MRIHRFLFTTTLVSFLALGGCSVFTDAPPLQNYILLAPEIQTNEPPLLLHLQVMPVDVGTGLDTTRIAFIDNDVQMNYLVDSRWAQPLPDMLQLLWIQALKQSGLGVSVGSDTDGELADHVIHITASTFNAFRNHDGSIVVRVHYEVVVTAPLTRKVLSVDDSASEQTISASTPSPEELVNAFNKANIQAMNDLAKKLAVDLRN
jgi:ABC-type uncharacterized transport system auxiliary subunit